MSALAKLSDIWLVAKMVQGLFETILKATGFGKYTLEGTKRFKQIGEHKVPVFSFVNEPLSKNQSTKEPKEDGVPLAHALLSYQKATLNSVSGTGEGAFDQSQKSAIDYSGISSSNLHSASSNNHGSESPLYGDPWATTLVQPPIQDTFQYHNATFHDNMNYIPLEQMVTWMQPDFPNMIPTTTRGY